MRIPVDDGTVGSPPVVYTKMKIYFLHHVRVVNKIRYEFIY